MARVKVERVRTTVQFPKALHAALHQAAEERYTTAAQLVVEAVQQYLAVGNGKPRPER
jgi:metal-responsive CopG/Arc/MetJ family transcriptional regulator